MASQIIFLCLVKNLSMKSFFAKDFYSQYWDIWVKHFVPAFKRLCKYATVKKFLEIPAINFEGHFFWNNKTVSAPLQNLVFEKSFTTN